MCCVCAGSCNHIGNHSYCSAHGGSTHPSVTTTGTSMGWGPPVVPTPPTPVVTNIYERPCEHCFCLETQKYGEAKHKECCMCGTRKIKKNAKHSWT